MALSKHDQHVSHHNTLIQGQRGREKFPLPFLNHNNNTELTTYHAVCHDLHYQFIKNGSDFNQDRDYAL